MVPLILLGIFTLSLSYLLFMLVHMEVSEYLNKIIRKMFQALCVFHSRDFWTGTGQFHGFHVSFNFSNFSQDVQ